MEESPIQWLERRIAHLGRHYYRYLDTARQHACHLTDRLEQASMSEAVELWSLSSSPEQAMRLAGSVGTNTAEKLDFLATYYSLQFLHMNLLDVDRLELALADAERRNDGYRCFVGAQAQIYQRLNACYIDCLLHLFMDGEPLPVFTICVVGTPWDQDDVDIVVLREGPPNERFNQALGRTCAEFFRRAGRLHLYIAENIGLTGYSGSVQEYLDLLSSNLNDFVMISELLSAEPLLGSLELFHEFQKRIVRRFYRSKGPYRKYHEAFLRGLLGEIHAQLVADVRRDRIDFKKDALRLIKGVTQAGRVAFDLSMTNPLVVLDRLCSKRPDLAEAFETLGESLLFIEVFRLLYQVLVVQEETVELNRETEPLLEQVALVMGYSEKGGVSAASHVVVHYFEAVERARFTCHRLQAPLTEYVEAVSGYSYASQRSLQGKRRNLALEIAQSVRMFRGHIFLDDVLHALRANHGQLAKTFVSDTLSLKPLHRQQVLDSLTTLASSDPMSLLDLMLVIHVFGGSLSQQLFDALLETIFHRMEEEDGLLPGLVGVYNTNPQVMNRFIEALSRPQRQRFESYLQVDLWEEDEQEALERLRKYIWLRTAGSEFYRRMFRRVVAKNPQFIHHILDVERLMTFAFGFLALPDSKTDTQAIECLGDYYDVAYLACAIRAITGQDLDSYRIPYIEFVDAYINALYFQAKKQIRASFPDINDPNRDIFAVFATGGYARGQAFDDDYDLVLLANTEDPRLLDFYTQISMVMHRELVRRGTIPQYRFADSFGTFVQPFSHFKQWFLEGRAETVDKTQLLGARLVVGSSRFAARLNDEILSPLIMDSSQEFMAELAAEMVQRHETFFPSSGRFDIKESPGALRDIEQLMLLLKMCLRIPGPVGAPFLERVLLLRPDLGQLIAQFHSCWDHLRRVRDLFRLLVAAQDEMSPEDMGPVAAAMGLLLPDKRGDGPGLFALTCATMRQVTDVGSRLRASLGCLDVRS